MGRSMYNFHKQSKEEVRQRKQLDKASKRLLVKQQKAAMKTDTPNAVSDIVEPGLVEEIVKSIA